MSRQESDREDLIREAVALQCRTELQVPGFPQLVTAGFRPGDALSLFFGQDPVYQFDPRGRLRRAFSGGVLYRSHPPTLAQLRRERSDTQTLLLRTDLDASALVVFQTTMRELLKQLLSALESGGVVPIRTVPEGDDLIPRLHRMVETILTADPWLSDSIRKRHVS